MKKLLLALSAMFMVAGCQTDNIDIKLPSGETLKATFYDGSSSNNVPDLLIVNGINHFGTLSYDQQNKLGDISFAFNTGEKIRAECIDSYLPKYSDDKKCAKYEIYRSSFTPIPAGSTFDNPDR